MLCELVALHTPEDGGQMAQVRAVGMDEPWPGPEKEPLLVLPASQEHALLFLL